MANPKNVPPPKFNEDVDTWTEYKKEIEIWKALTNLEPARQGPALYVALTGKAKEIVKVLSAEQVTAENGLATILAELDKLYEKDKCQSAYLTYKEFLEFKRSDDMSMKDFIVKFETLNTKIKAKEFALPDGALAYHLLDMANLDDDSMKLVKATLTNLEYELMKERLLNIFGDEVVSSASGGDNVKIKSEPIFYNNRGGYRDNNRGGYREYNRGGYKNRGRFQRGRGRGQSKTVNPPSRCTHCDSKFHWVQSCPEFNKPYIGFTENTTKNDEEEIILLQTEKYDEQNLNTLLTEALGCAVVDSGCSKTVAGKQWFDCFKRSVNQEFKLTKSTQTFRFGYGGAVMSLGKVKIPICIGRKNVFLITDIVDINIPLLLSKESMKKANMVLDFNNDTARMFGQNQKLISTTSGHYALPIVLARKEDCLDDQIVLVNEVFTDKPYYRKIALHLHRQFCHCSAERLKKLIKSSNLWESDAKLLKAIDTISKTCKICTVYKKAPPTPVVSLPMASDFNEVVAMDLITIKQGLWIIHLIDLFSRYSIAAVTRSKKQNIIVDLIMRYWISYFGKPKRFLADNGGEFTGSQYSDMCEMFDIQIIKNPAESPWSNGLCERHNGVIKESVKKTMEDTGCSLEVATSWATCAKNSLLGHKGYSPNTLVFGRNPNFPSIICNNPPALCDDHLAVTVEKNLRAMHSARRAFIEAEASEKIQRALRHNIRSCNDVILHSGDRVYFKRNNDQRWHGPGIVIGQQNKHVLVKVGSECISVHTSRVIRTDNVAYDNNNIKKTPKQSRPSNHKSSRSKNVKSADLPSSILQKYHYYDEDEDDDDEDENDANDDDEDDAAPMNEGEQIQDPDIRNGGGNNADGELDHQNNVDDNPFLDEADENEYTNIVHNETADEIAEHIENTMNDTVTYGNNDVATITDHETDDSEFFDALQNYPIASTHVTDVENSDQGDTDVEEQSQEDDASNKEEVVYPKIKSTIMFKLEDAADRWQEGFVHSRGGKVKGRNKGCFNIQDPKTGDICWYDFDTHVVEWEPVPSETYITNMDKDSILLAKRKELENWKNNNVYTEVPPDRQDVISTRWVITTKETQGSMITKARLVARGFEDDGLKDNKTDSPTCCKETIRIILALISTKGWNCKTFDVKTAFLQGNPLTRDIYLQPPKEANTTDIWKLNKAVYGLNEASRYWYEKANQELTQAGMTKSKYDEALYFYRSNDRCQGIVGLHVDDFMHGGTNILEENVLNKLRQSITIGREEITPLTYLGINVRQEKNEITMNQQHYLDNIEECDINFNRNEKHRYLNHEEQRSYRAICGQLNWLATQSRPDISYDVCKLSTKLNEATVQDVIDANKTLRKVKANKVELKFKKMKPPLKLIGYCDASYANLPNGGSQGGHIVFLTDCEGNAAPLTWCSRKLRRVCRSTLTAETMSLLDTIDVCIWLKHIIDEIDGELLTTVIKTDNKSLYESAHSTKLVEERRLRVELGSIRESIRKGEIILEWVEGNVQIADSLTKQGANVNALLKVLNEACL